MRVALPEDQEHIIGLFKRAFQDNKSIHASVRQGRAKSQAIVNLFRFCLTIAQRAQRVYLSEGREAAAILIRKSEKTMSLADYIFFIFNCCGITRIPKVLRLEGLLKKHYPKVDYFHLWLLGVDPQFQNLGKGSAMMEQLMTIADEERLPVYLETSLNCNLDFYAKQGFRVFERVWNGYDLHLLKREVHSKE